MDIFIAESCEPDPVSLVVPSGGKREVLARFEETLKQMRDPRRRQGQRYPLRSVVVIALLAMVCGADDAQALQAWGEANEGWLLDFLDLPHGVPTQDVFLAVFSALAPAEFSGVFVSWVELVRQAQTEEGRHIAVDGKTSRRSFDKGSGKAAVHTVSAWLSEEGCVLGQTRTAARSNRLEARTVHICKSLAWVSEPGRWSNLGVLVEVESTRTDLSTGKSSQETRYYIGDDSRASAERTATLIRRHWSIENELHWVLDMAFHEDQARHRARNCADNFATLRHFAINLLKKERTCKLGVANKRKRAGWDRDYLFQILTGTSDQT